MNRTLDIVVPCLLALSIGLNVAFIYREKGRQSAPPSIVPAVGTMLPTLKVETLTEEPIELGYGSSQRPRLIYAFSPECAWCERNLAGIRALAEGLRESHDVIGVATRAEDLAAYLKDVDMGFQIYQNPNAESRQAYGFGPTPQTLVVDAMGEVLFHWHGAYGADVVQQIAKHLGVTVPAVAGLP